MLAPNVILATFVIEAEAAGFRRELPAPIVMQHNSDQGIIEGAFSFCADCFQEYVRSSEAGGEATELSGRGGRCFLVAAMRGAERAEAETGAGTGTHLSVVPQTPPSVLHTIICNHISLVVTLSQHPSIYYSLYSKRL